MSCIKGNPAGMTFGAAFHPIKPYSQLDLDSARLGFIASTAHTLTLPAFF